MEESDFVKLLNSAVEPIIQRLTALEKQQNASPVPITEDPVIKDILASVKLLNEAMPLISGIKAEQEAAKDQKARAAFGKFLNAGHLEDGKVPDKLWNEAKADPIGYLDSHPEAKLSLVEERNFVGKILNADGSTFDIAVEQAKLWGYQ